MQGTGLQINVTANTSGVQAGMQRAVRSVGSLRDQLSRFQGYLRNATDPQAIARLNRAIDATRQRIDALNRMGRGNPFGGVTRDSQQATASLTDLSRIAQDAPYGFMAIANNINPAIESFGRLRAQAGGLRGALIALGGALTGPAGIGLAVAVASSLMVAFGDKLFKTANKGEELRKKMDAAREATENFIATLSDQNQARLDGIKNARQELVSLETLYKASQNHNLSLAERKKAVDALQEQYPAYFKNIQDEVILAGGATKAYRSLRDAIIQTAMARAQQDKIVDLSKQLDDIVEQRATAAKEWNAAAREENKVLKGIQKNRSAVKVNDLSYAVEEGKIGDALRKKQLAQQKYNDLKKQELDLTERIKRLGESLQRTVETGGVQTITGRPGGKTKEPKEQRSEFDFFDRFFNFNPDSAKLTGKQKRQLLDAVKAFNKEVGEVVETVNVASFGRDQEGALKAAKAWWQKWLSGDLELKAPKIKVDYSDVPDIDTNTRIQAVEWRQAMQEQLDKELGQPLTVHPDIVLSGKITTDYVDKFREIGFKIPPIPVGVQFDPKALDNFLKQVYSLTATIDGIMKNTMSNVASTFGETLGEALNGGDVDGGIKKIIGFLGDAISQIGKALIEYGVVKEGLDKILAAGIALPGAAAIAAGIAAVAMGTLVKNSTAKIPGFWRGTKGKKAPPGMKWVGEKGPELLYDPGGYGIMSNPESMRFMKQINSMKLPKFDLGALSGISLPKIDMGGIMSGLQMPSIVGGPVFGDALKHIQPASTTVNISGNMSITGDQLKLLLSRTERRQNRNF